VSAGSIRWRLSLAAGAFCMIAGARLHPSFDYTQPTFDLIVASALFSSAWAPVHALILAGLILVTAGLSGLVRSGLLSGAALRAGRLALAGAALSALEMTFHLIAFLEREAAIADRPTPLIDIHQALQVASHPLLGFSVATLSILEFGRLRGSALDWPWRIASVIGVLGAAAHGLAGPLTILTRDARFGNLFAGAGPMALYVGLYALAASRFQRRVGRDAFVSVSAAG
jgi:hypothetical protein